MLSFARVIEGGVNSNLNLVDLETERQAREIFLGARFDYNHVKPKQRLGWKTSR